MASSVVKGQAFISMLSVVMRRQTRVEDGLDPMLMAGRRVWSAEGWISCREIDWSSLGQTCSRAMRTEISA